MLKFLLPLTSFLMVLSANAYACVASDLTDAQILSRPELKTIISKVQDAYGITISVESLVRSGANILDLDQKVVARAMCAANFINVYLKPTFPDPLRCMTTFELNQDGKFVYEGIRSGAQCQPSVGAPPKWIDVRI